ncbi:hypothetical protein F5I97DRAFT_1867304 [Phlebopus sp. FC_14]|nr:hypothetical protein F5I97DRAFT_1867304 [Phlebopus sp. FC_14]
MLAPGRSQSQPIGESSQGPSFGRRTQSELTLHVPTPVYPPPTVTTASPVPRASAPSPAPTEIIPADLTQEEIAEEIQRGGIKVRDFAYESVPVTERAPELFDPILAWNHYEVALSNPDPGRNPVSGRSLRRLLDLGWVAEAADGMRWFKKDREALEAFDSRPQYPWKAFNLAKPKKEELREVATARFQHINADQLLPAFVNRGMGGLAAMFRRRREEIARYEKRTADDSGSDEDPELSPRLKKRRLSTGASAFSQSQPRPVQHVPVALVNGKPPQQFPAGRPLVNSPRPQPPPSAAPLGRSLQRQPSMASVSSMHPTDLLSRSDSRTQLTQGAES